MNDKLGDVNVRLGLHDVWYLYYAAPDAFRGSLNIMLWRIKVKQAEKWYSLPGIFIFGTLKYKRLQQNQQD